MPSDIPDAAHPSQSVLTIDLGAIASNYRALRERTGKAKCAAAIKADAYGLGATQVGPALAAAGCQDFFVANLGEALALRAALPKSARVYVLGGFFAGEGHNYIHHGLLPVLNDLGQIAAWAEVAGNAGRALPAAIHIDTGMSRLGLPPAEVKVLADDVRRLKGIELRYWMSHLACADEPENALNQQQLSNLSAALAPLPHASISLANSSGIFLGTQYHFDLVRPGCALYGINPVPGQLNPMRQVVRLDAKVLQIRTIDQSQTVGYGATHRAGGTTRVATIAAGYADGCLRSLSNRGFAVVNGQKVPFIGRVSMDLITLDVTSLPDLKPGDFVELMGTHLTADHVADLAGTIGYEILTRLGTRFHRRYVNDHTAAPA